MKIKIKISVCSENDVLCAVITVPPSIWHPSGIN